VSANAGAIITGIATDTVTDTAPAVPSNITTSSPSTGNLTVSWDAVTDDDLREYRLYAAASSGFTPSASNLVYSGTATSVSVGGLPSAATIYMQLVAVDYIEGGLNYSSEFSQTIT
jgi:bacillopeptidase F